MKSRLRPLALVLALATYPQAAWSQAEGAPIERRLRIVLQSEDGAPVSRPDAPPQGGSNPPAAASPTVAAEVLQPLAPSAPGSTEAPRMTVPADWTADALRTPLRPDEGWRIQVGAFRDAARAEARIAELEPIAAGPGADPMRFVVPARDVFRAQIGGFIDRAAADAACARIAATGAGCFVVSPATGSPSPP